VHVMDSSRDMAKQVTADVKRVQDSEAAVQAHQAELVGQPDALRDMVGQWQAEKEESCEDCQDVSEEVY
jgi:hypothetical protein